MKKILCPKCKQSPFQLIEVWTHSTIELLVVNGVIDREGHKNYGNPFKVMAECNCGHIWRLRGVQQITEAYEKNGQKKYEG